MPLTSSYVPQVYDAVYAYYLAFDKMAREGAITEVGFQLEKNNTLGSLNTWNLKPFLFFLLQYDSAATLRRLVFDELKKFNDKKNGFVGAQGLYKNSHEGDSI